MAKSKFTRVEVFWSFVAKSSEPDGCWLWTGGLNTPGGYPNFWNGTDYELGHRWAYRTFAGQIPEDQRVLHRCDQPRCVRVDHLFLGTQAENIWDMENKGRARHPRGEDSGLSKLTDEQAREIRAVLADAMLQPVKRSGIPMPYPRSHAPRGVVAQLASRFGVSRRAIWHVGRGVTYTHRDPLKPR